MFFFGGKDKFGRKARRKSNSDMQKDVNKKKKDDDDSDDEKEPDMLSQSVVLDLQRRLRLYVHDDTQQCFESFDVTGTGCIHFPQVKQALKSFYIDADDDDCEAIISAFDTTGSGKITYDDFFREMRDVMAGGTSEMHIKMVFDMMDEDGDGSIGIEEIKNQFKKLGIFLSDDEAMEHLSQIDLEGNGFIDYEMFRDYCNRKDLVQVIGKESAEHMNLMKEESYSKNYGGGH